MECADHAGVGAAGACVYCGRLMCGQCLVDVGGKRYCRADVGKVFQEATQQRQPQQQTPMVFMNAGGGGAAASAAATAPAPMTNVIIRKPSFNHGLHLFLTLITCGVWLPVWVIAAVFS